ncbi:hypothetical protein [Chryseobacterium aquaticum]|jgi:hypothetical protein|uniref:hypothetical protein n=1 Tax=Chryseobacterium aquaticum TaxID=452084 RepID=UPI002FC862F5
MSNLTNNRLNTTLTSQQVAEVKTAIQTIYASMPFLLGLTVEERIALPKINVANKAFAEDAINAISNNAEMLPDYLKVEDMKTDLQLFSQLDELSGLVRQLLEKIEDTQILAGSEAYVAALVGYKLFGAATSAGIPGSDAIYDGLKARFASASVPKQETTTESVDTK